MNITEKMLAKEVSTRLHSIKGKMSGVEFANKCELTQSTMSSYLTGGSLPGAYNLLKISEATNISVGELLTGKETKEEQNEREGEGMGRILIGLEVAGILDFLKSELKAGNFGPAANGLRKAPCFQEWQKKPQLENRQTA